MTTTLPLTDTAKRRLQEVAEWLEAGAPHIVRHDCTIAGFDMDVGVLLQPECGAVCCIAGALVQFNYPYQATLDDEEEVLWRTIHGMAAGLLGLSGSREDLIRTDHLFRSSAENEWITPAIAAQVLRHLIATGEVDWDRFDPDRTPDFEDED